MFVPAMTNLEITTEFCRDYEKVLKSIQTWMWQDYDRERKKLKIDKAATYPKNYTIKTGSKNNWIVFLQKRHAASKYRGSEDIFAIPVTYFYNEFGLRALRFGENCCIEAFNGHFFKRYNERLQLNLPDTISILKNFFTHNNFVKAELITKGNQEFAVSVCKDGLSLGRFCKNNLWIIHNTFISHDLKRPDQVDIERQVMSIIEKQLAEKEQSDKGPFHDYTYYFATEMMAQLKKVS